MCSSVLKNKKTEIVFAEFLSAKIISKEGNFLWLVKII